MVILAPNKCLKIENTNSQVEYLLLECLQDLTGGYSAFFLASYSLMVDITTDRTRTRRLSFLDAFWEIGYLIGVPLGTYIKNQHGYIAVFSVAAVVILACILYVIFIVKEKEKHQTGETDGPTELKIKLDKSKKWECFRLI